MDGRRDIRDHCFFQLVHELKYKSIEVNKMEEIDAVVEPLEEESSVEAFINLKRVDMSINGGICLGAARRDLTL